MSKPFRQYGFGLLEILIAMAVMTVGLLGLAGMHLQGMRHTQSSNTLSTASELAREMAERLRANLRGVDDNHYASVNLANTACDPTPDCPDNSRTCYGTQCDAAGLAGADITAWHRKLCQLMPCGTAATVTCVDSDGTDSDPCTDGSRHDVLLVWEDRAVRVEDGVRRSGTAENRLLLVINPLNPVR